MKAKNYAKKLGFIRMKKTDGSNYNAIGGAHIVSCGAYRYENDAGEIMILAEDKHHNTITINDDGFEFIAKKTFRDFESYDKFMDEIVDNLSYGDFSIAYRALKACGLYSNEHA